MKRYFVFGFSQERPEGGMADFKDQFDSLSRAIQYIKEEVKYDCGEDLYDVIDMETVNFDLVFKANFTGKKPEFHNFTE